MKRSLLTLLLVLSLLLAGCEQLGLAEAQPAEPTPLPTLAATGGIQVEGRLVPSDFTSLAFPLAGTVGEVLVAEGQAVSAGDPLLHLEDSEILQAARSAAQLELAAAQQAYDELADTADLASQTANSAVAAARQAELDARIALDALDTDRFRQDLDDAEIDVDDRQRELEDAQAEVDEKSDLDPDNATRKAAEEALEDAQQAYDDAVEARDGLRNQLSSAEQALALAGARLADAQRQADARANGPDPDELDLAQRRLDNARAQLAAAEAALADLELTAPYDGTVVSLSISAGEQVAPGQALIVFADYSSWYVETTDLTEMDVIQIHPGDSAIVVPDAVDSLELSGTVESINDAYRERSGDVLYTARLRLAERDERLRWGMTVAVTFED